MGPAALAGVTAAAGLVQAGVGYFQGRKAKKQLESLQTPTYTKSKSISDYYNQALSRYNENPYQSNLYKMQAQNIARGTAQGLSALQDRRSALSGVSGLVQSQNDSLLKAGAMAEQQKDQRFGQLGTASQAMAGEERQAFNINQMMPYQKKYDILSQKAAGGAQLMNAGLQNVFGGLGAASFYKSDAQGGGSSQSQGAGYDQGRYLPPSTYQVPLAKY